MTEVEEIEKKLRDIETRMTSLLLEYSFVVDEFCRAMNKELQLQEMGKQQEEWWTQLNDDEEWINKH